LSLCSVAIGRKLPLLFTNDAEDLTLGNHNCCFFLTWSICLLTDYKLPVTGGLQFKHFRVAAAEIGQCLVVSFFRDATVLEHHNSIRHTHG
jgi:hypothetical protein